MPKKKPKIERPLLTDHQCHVYVHSMREFGYPSTTFDVVRKVADQVHAGTHSETNVLAIIMCKEIDDAMRTRKGR